MKQWGRHLLHSPQETNDQTVIFIRKDNETYSDPWFQFPKNDLTKPAREEAASFSNEDVATQALEILEKLKERLDKLDRSDLPFLNVSERDDGSVMIEWIFNHYRIGISIELDESESGWYLVSDKSAGGINALGYLENTDMNWLISWLVCFVESSLELSG